MEQQTTTNPVLIKVMVIDANLKSLRKLQRGLGKETKIEVIGTHKRGRSALNALRNDPVDLVFLNPELGDLNGFDLISYLHQPPLIVMVSDRYDYGYFAFQIGAIDFINTDFSDSEFRTCLEKALLEVDRRKVYKAYLELQTAGQKKES